MADSKSLSVAPFDYSEVDKDTKGKLIALAGEINRGLKQFQAAGNEIGKAVCEAHRLLADHRKGLFEHWVESETGIGLSTAYNLKNLLERSADFPIIGKLPPTVGYLLAAPSVPPEAIREVEKAVSMGQRATVQFAKATLDRFREVAPKNGKPPKKPPPPDLGKCPNCGGKKWKDDGLGHVCAKCRHPHGEPAGNADEDKVGIQRSKTVKTVEALMRAFDDLNRMLAKADHKEAITSCKWLLKLAKGWK